MWNPFLCRKGVFVQSQVFVQSRFCFFGLKGNSVFFLELFVKAYNAVGIALVFSKEPSGQALVVEGYFQVCFQLNGPVVRQDVEGKGPVCLNLNAFLVYSGCALGKGLAGVD